MAKRDKKRTKEEEKGRMGGGEEREGRRGSVEKLTIDLILY